MKNKPAFFRRNIDGKGRLIRGAMAAAILAGGIAALKLSAILAAICFISALFVAYEALRGWCVLRACGVRTKF